ncbi:MAG: hypothetical protein QM489_01185 [Candidatus Izemoplasma sp.]
MSEIDPRIAPKEFIVGTKEKSNLCYLTYMVKNKMNSQTSWEGWSDNSKNPNKFTNEWAFGFKIAGNNSRGWGKSVNRDHILIEHPLCKKTFELSLDNFLELAYAYNIEKGEIMAQLLVNNKRELIHPNRYMELLKEADKKDAKSLKRKTKLRIKATDLEIGKVYECANQGFPLIFLGTISLLWKNGAKATKYCYKSFGYPEKGRRVANDSLFYRRRSYNSSGQDKIMAWQADYCSKSRKPVSKAKKDINVFDTFTGQDWKVFIEEHESIHEENGRLNTYWLKEQDNDSRYRYGSYVNQSSKFSKITVNFLKEYLHNKQNRV